LARDVVAVWASAGVLSEAAAALARMKVPVLLIIAVSCDCVIAWIAR